MKAPYDFSTFFLSLFLLLVPLEAGNVVTIKGSDTMVILNQRWAELYMKKNKNETIQVTGGGSGTGIAALINGGTDIASASRRMRERERHLAEKRGGEVLEIPVALDGVTIYVNVGNPVDSLTLEELKGIYTGKITNWKEVGGFDRKIIKYSRENNSGTYMYFQEVVLENRDYSDECQNLPGTAAVVNAVSKDIGGIGYGGIAYSKGVKVIALKKTKKDKAYYPTKENIKKGLYPLSRKLFYYVFKSKYKGEIRKFIEWVLSLEGQRIVEEVGYIPIH